MATVKKENVWLKIGKLFIEFVIAAVTALATSKSASALGLF